MDVAASVDRLISSLQTFKSAIPSLERGEVASEFDALFADASAKLDRLASGSDLGAALDEASAIADGVGRSSSPLPAMMTSVRQPEQALAILRNTDGTASVLFPGGGIHTVSSAQGLDPVTALQSAYGDRISRVTSSGKSAVELAAQQRQVRVTDELATISATLANKPKYAGGAATGFDPIHIKGYLGSLAGQLANADVPADKYVSDAASQGAVYLSRYLAPEQVAEMTQRQLLAASELMTQGGGVKESNYLSAEDLDFILNKANDFQGAVWSPVGQAISLGAGSGEAARYVSSGS